MARPEHVKCANCVFFERDEDRSDGFCHRNAPTMGDEGWPLVSDDEFCGEFRAKWPEEDKARVANLPFGHLDEQLAEIHRDILGINPGQYTATYSFDGETTHVQIEPRTARRRWWRIFSIRKRQRSPHAEQ